MTALPGPIDGWQWNVDDVDMICPAWWVLNIQVLFQGPTVVIANRQQAGTNGRKGYPGITDEAKVSLRFVINGTVNSDGDPYEDPREGLIANYDFLRTNVFDPVDPLRTSTLSLPSGPSRIAQVQFDPFPLAAADGGWVEDTLGVTVVGGAHYAA